jgi:uncharacterized damage-inducible protein DinB
MIPATNPKSSEENFMIPSECTPNRRSFLRGSLTLAAGLSTLSGLSAFSATSAAAAENSWIIGPQPGFTPEVGTLTSMLAFTRDQVVHNVKGLSQQDLDWLLDAKANTIGALLMHLAATETLYAMNTFGGMKWDAWPDEVKKKWDIPMNLGQPARAAIKGNSLDYYLDALHQSREKSLAEFRKVDDKWLSTVMVDGDFSVNNYAKWFHVAEHESNHDGQIKFLKSRVPGAKPATE